MVGTQKCSLDWSIKYICCQRRSWGYHNTIQSVPLTRLHISVLSGVPWAETVMVSVFLPSNKWRELMSTGHLIRKVFVCPKGASLICQLEKKCQLQKSGTKKQLVKDLTHRVQINVGSCEIDIEQSFPES